MQTPLIVDDLLTIRESLRYKSFEEHPGFIAECDKMEKLLSEEVHLTLANEDLSRLDRESSLRMARFEHCVSTLDAKIGDVIRSVGVLGFGSTFLMHWSKDTPLEPWCLFFALLLLLLSGVCCLIGLKPRPVPTEPEIMREAERIATLKPDLAIFMSAIGRDCLMEAYSILSSWKAASLRLAYTLIVIALTMLLMAFVFRTPANVSPSVSSAVSSGATSKDRLPGPSFQLVSQ